MAKTKTYEENIKIAANYDWNTGVDMLRNINKDQIDESKTENVYFDESSQVRYVKTFDEKGNYMLQGIQQTFKENGEIESSIEYDRGVKIEKEW